MPIKKYLRRIERMHDLIRKRATGNPEEFAERLDFNRSTLYKYLATMKELGAPIAYDQFSETYYYTEEVEFLPFFSKKVSRGTSRSGNGDFHRGISAYGKVEIILFFKKFHSLIIVDSRNLHLIQHITQQV